MLGAGQGRLQDAVLEGLVASIGGLDGSLAQAASSALIAWLRPLGVSAGGDPLQRHHRLYKCVS